MAYVVGCAIVRGMDGLSPAEPPHERISEDAARLLVLVAEVAGRIAPRGESLSAE
jgi:hypothetical protein